MAEHTIWKREEAFWLGGADLFREQMHPSAQMVFPDPVGILTGEAVLMALEAAPRWTEATLSDRSLAQTETTLCLAYRAVARREDAAPYEALCTSTYVFTDGSWRLLSHQQAPLG
jgi:hypothetical protein